MLETRIYIFSPVHNDLDNHHLEGRGNLDNDHKYDHWDHLDHQGNEGWHLDHLLLDTNNQAPYADCDHVGCKSHNI